MGWVGAPSSAAARAAACFHTPTSAGFSCWPGERAAAHTAMQSQALAGRAAPSGAARASRSRQQQRLVAFQGFRRPGVVDGAASAPASLQAAVQRQVAAAARSSGVRTVRVTRMMFERFTEKAIKVVMLAQEEARRLGHNFVGTEQILLGLIGESTGARGLGAARGGREGLPPPPPPAARRLPARAGAFRLGYHPRALTAPLCPPLPAPQASPPRCSSPWA